MKVVIVNAGLAYPPTGGNWLRTLNLMLPLASRHEITYICRGAAEEGAVERARAFYAQHGIRTIITEDVAPGKRGPAFYARLAANLLSPLPYSIAAHRSPGVRREVRRIAARENVDLFQFEALSYADTLIGTKERSLTMAHNVESLIWQRMYEMERRPHRRWYIGHQWRKYERYEARALRGATRVVAVSDEDAMLMRERFGVADASVVGNGVDVGYFADCADRTGADPREILFLGSLDWLPNLDSIDLLLDRILPEVLAVEPGARLSIVGRNPSPALIERVRAHPSVALHANVPDVRPYLARAGVLAVPLRIGGGSRLKILEAAAAGLPVVSTRVGCEGLTFEPGRDMTVVEHESEVARALVDCIRHPQRAAARAAHAKTVVEARYDWSQLADRLEGIWHEVVAGARSPVVA